MEGDGSRPDGFRVRGRRVPPALALFVLSPVIAELCLGSTPPLLFFLPPFLFLNLGLYGAGSLLVRELVVRWGRGWPSILALGVAYAIVEEGLALMTMFNEKTGPRVDANLGTYGAGPDGANWVWIATLCAYHAVFSIALPILVVHLAYPAEASRRWLGGRRLAATAFFLVFVVVLCRIGVRAATGADLDAGQQTDSVLAIALLVLLASRLPAGVPRLVRGRMGGAVAESTAPTPRRVAVIVFAATLLFFFGFAWGGRGLGVPAALTVSTLAAIPLAVAGWIGRSSIRPGWSDAHRYAVATGLLGFFVLFGPVEELAGRRLMLVVAIVLAVALRRGWRRFGREVTPAPAPPIAQVAPSQPA